MRSPLSRMLTKSTLRPGVHATPDPAPFDGTPTRFWPLRHRPGPPANPDRDRRKGDKCPTTNGLRRRNFEKKAVSRPNIYMVTYATQREMTFGPSSPRVTSMRPANSTYLPVKCFAKSDTPCCFKAAHDQRNTRRWGGPPRARNGLEYRLWQPGGGPFRRISHAVSGRQGISVAGGRQAAVTSRACTTSPRSSRNEIRDELKRPLSRHIAQGPTHLGAPSIRLFLVKLRPLRA
jgi:hypothetical protein